MYRIVFLVVSSLFFVGCNQHKPATLKLPYYNEPTFTPVFVEEHADLNKKITHTIANFSLLNQDSVLINQTIIEGKIHVANFIFTSCGSICPKMINNMKLVNDSLGVLEDLVLLSYSVTPWIDQPFLLNKFKKKYEIENKNWHFLTGDKGDIYQLARQSYFAEEDIGFSKDSTEFLHTEHFILVDRTKRIRGIYNGTLALEMHQLIADINTVYNEQ